MLSVFSAYIKKTDNSILLGLGILIFIFLTTISALYILDFSPFEHDYGARFAPPGSPHHLLGTDNYGRDIFARICYGAYVSISIGSISVIMGGILGSFFGLLSGYLGGRFDLMAQRVVDALLAFPAICVGLMIVVVIGTGFWKLTIAIALTVLPNFVRLARAASMQVKQESFVEAAHAIGSHPIRIIFRHLLPNISSSLITFAVMRIQEAILLESGLSFLGLGIQPPTPTWGNMMRGGLGQLNKAPWISSLPGLALTLSVVALFFIGDGLRNYLDPKTMKTTRI
jgi:ABC-type dipeptide/oligopeptide/nickel transport system permease subunit